MGGRPCGALLALGLMAVGAPQVPALESTARPLLAEDIERRSEGRFLFTTDGDGTDAIFQKLDAPTGPLGDREVVCLMDTCYVAVDTVPRTVLERAGGDDEHVDLIRRVFKADRDAYEHALKAAAPERAGAEELWRDRLAKIGPCLRDKRAC